MTEFEEVIETRRSVHDYADEPLDDETIESIFEKVALSPSGYNLQPWEFLILREEENKQHLREAAYDQEHVTDAAAAVAVLGNKDPMAHAEAVFEDWLEKGHIPNEDVRDALLENVEGMADMPEGDRRVWTTRSTALACMTLMLAAWDEGVATCPMEGFDPDAVTDAFGVPDGYEPVMLVTMGYPADDAADIENERKARRPPEEIVHYEEFDPVEETTFGR
jgi:nitroreductase